MLNAAIWKNGWESRLTAEFRRKNSNDGSYTFCRAEQQHIGWPHGK